MVRIIFSMFAVYFIMTPACIYAKEYAYMFSRDTVFKFDTESNTIISNVTASDEIIGFNGVTGGYAVIDMNRQYLLTGVMRGDFGFNAYDAKTLMFKKFVPYPGVDSESFEYRFIYPKHGDMFYVQIQDNKAIDINKKMKNMSFGKEDLAYKGLVANVLSTIYEDYWFSEDGTRIYVESDDRKLRIHDAVSFALLETVDLTSFIDVNIKGLELSDIKHGSLLLSVRYILQGETNKVDSMLTYDLSTKKVTKLFATGIMTSDEYFTPASNKVVADEVIYSDQTFMEGPVTSLKLFMYEYETGTLLGTFEFPNTGLAGDILGMTTSGDKLYYIAYTESDNSQNMFVINLTDLSLISKVSIPDIDFIIFQDEPDEAPAQ